jgi:hypothetical protein
MSSYTARPHVYYSKKYVGIKNQQVTTNPPTCLYSGGQGIQGCISHLNNLNTMSGITMLMVNSICSMFGIPSKQFFSGEGEDFDSFTPTPKPVKFSQFTDQGLTSLVKTIENNTIDLKLKLAELTSKVETLERNLDALSSLDKIVNTLLQLDPTKINLILDIVKNIDQKV